MQTRIATISSWMPLAASCVLACSEEGDQSSIVSAEAAGYLVSTAVVSPETYSGLIFPLGHALQFVSRDSDEPDAWLVVMGETPSAQEASGVFTFDARTGGFVHEYPLNRGLMNVLFRLHTDLFAGLAGTLFLGLMGLLLVLSLVSGAVVYGPFMRKLPFGSVRFERASRIRWLDLHNLLGIATLLWLFTVGATGVINTLSRPILGSGVYLWLQKRKISVEAQLGVPAAESAV